VVVVSMPYPTFLPGPAELTQILLWIALVMLASLLVLYATVIIQKVLIERSKAAEQQLRARFAEALASGASLASLAVDPASLRHRRALAHTLVALSPADTSQQLLGAAWFPSLLERLFREARHRYWGRRSAAYETLGMLSAVSLRPRLMEAARRESHPRAYAACLQAVARLSRGPQEMTGIAQYLEHRHVLSGSFNEGIFRTLIGTLQRLESPEEAASHLRDLLHSLEAQPLLLLDAVSATGKSGLEGIVPALAALYGAREASLGQRIACARAIGALDPAHKALHKALADPAWQVQAAAARHFKPRDGSGLGALADRLGDANFYVRRNAALALRELGAQGEPPLRAAITGTDPFAAAIAHYVLCSRGPAHA
jgi:hypothetical protein